MAGDWIKIEHATPDKPEVDTMANRLGIDPDAVVGKLIRLWIWADQQSIDGNALSVTDSFIDRRTFCAGFADALRQVGWLEGRDGRLSIPNFDRHNGQSSKQRALTARRVANHKRKGNDPSVTSALPREEKRREEKNKKEDNPPPPSAAYDVQRPELPPPEAAAAAGITKISEEVFLRIADKIGVEQDFASALFADMEASGWRDSHGKPVVSPAVFLRASWERQRKAPPATASQQAAPDDPGQQQSWKIEADLKRIREAIRRVESNPANRNSANFDRTTKAEWEQRHQPAWLAMVKACHEEAREKLAREFAEFETAFAEEVREMIASGVRRDIAEAEEVRLSKFAERFSEDVPGFWAWDKSSNPEGPWPDPDGLTPAAKSESRLLRQQAKRVEALLREALLSDGGC